VLKYPHSKIENIVEEVRLGLNKRSKLIDLTAGGLNQFSTLYPLFNYHIINEYNTDLYNFYITVAKHPEKVFNEVSELVFRHNHSIDKPLTYKTNLALLNSNVSYIQKAALLYYINRTAYSNFIRYNTKGIINSPYGDKRRIEAPNPTFWYPLCGQIQRCKLMNKYYYDVKIEHPLSAVVLLDLPLSSNVRYWKDYKFNHPRYITYLKYLQSLNVKIILTHEDPPRLIGF
jgi:site-specific DNA-adenine methylase